MHVSTFLHSLQNTHDSCMHQFHTYGQIHFSSLASVLVKTVNASSKNGNLDTFANYEIILCKAQKWIQNEF